MAGRGSQRRCHHTTYRQRQPPPQNARKRLAKLALSLFATVPKGYHLLTNEDLHMLVHVVGAVEDCATRIPQDSVKNLIQGHAIAGRSPVELTEEGMPEWGEPCYPNVSNVPTYYVPTNRALAEGYRFRIDPAILMVCMSILGNQVIPTAKEKSPELYERFVHTMTEACAFAHCEAAARYFRQPQAKPITEVDANIKPIDANVIWPWLPNEGAPTVELSSKWHGVTTHEDKLDDTEEYVQVPESDPVLSSSTINGL